MKSRCKCYECEMCKKLDEEARLESSWWDVELFRITKGRLPNQDGDDLTKKLAKQYIDRFVFGNEEHPSSSCDIESLKRFAFHVYSSTNLAYKNDIPKHGSEKQRALANAR